MIFNLAVAADVLREAAAAITAPRGDVLAAHQSGALGLAPREPPGVLAASAPLERPAHPRRTGRHRAADGLLKAGEDAPTSYGLQVADGPHEAGLPDEVLNVIPNAREDADRRAHLSARPRPPPDRRPRQHLDRTEASDRPQGHGGLRQGGDRPGRQRRPAIRRGATGAADAAPTGGATAVVGVTDIVAFGRVSRFTARGAHIPDETPVQRPVPDPPRQRFPPSAHPTPRLTK
ncbi:hypothetical protein [Streptomyces sp. NPDC047061]|uniref:hypothetical protein n=1 Tax=Streptomyces sp. NPDC047061 TaxID=3154605 RepID=UPI0033FB7785